MVWAWTKTEGNQILDLVFHLLGAFAIVYILVRHALLEKGKLRPGAYKCFDCLKALRACIEGNSEPTPVFQRRTSLQQEADSRQLEIVYFCTIGSVAGYVFYCVNGSLLLMGQSMALRLLPFAYCYYALKMSPIFIVTSKCLMYAVFVARLALGFEGSSYAFSKRVINALYFVVVFYGVVWDSLALAFMHGHATTFAATNTHFCEIHDPGWAGFHFMIPFAALFDFCISFSLVYCFTSALRKMLRGRVATVDKRVRKSDIKSQAHLYLLPLKYTVISTVAIVSSSTSWLLYSITGSSFAVPIDCVVNSAALVLMNANWHPIYELVCSPLLRCVARCPCVDLTEAELVKEMQATTASISGELLRPNAARPRAGTNSDP